MRVSTATTALALALAGCSSSFGASPLAQERVAPERSFTGTYSFAAGPRSAQPQFSVIHTFKGGDDGATPYAGLIADKSGAFYGTTYAGGLGDHGTVFKLTPSSNGFKESVLYSFKGPNDGSGPYASLLMGDKGTLFGTTSAGGSGPVGRYEQLGGTVFKLTPRAHGYVETVLYAFKDGFDGATPLSNLIRDERGMLFGTTQFGGVNQGSGTVYELTPARSGYTFSIAHTFQNPNTDGQYPTAGVISDRTGSLYGTTEYGSNTGYPYLGTVYKMRPESNGYVEALICNFGGFASNYGVEPIGGLIEDANGDLFGTTNVGGSGCPSQGCGVVFKLTGSGWYYQETLLYNFLGSPDGAYPTAGLTADNAGSFYGTTSGGGSSACSGGCGTVFRLSPNSLTIGGYTETILYTFLNGTDGSSPYAGLLLVNGALYGTTTQGGAKGLGTAFKITL